MDEAHPHDGDLLQFLGERAYSILSLISDPRQQTRVSEVLRICADALQLLDEFDLEKYELSESDVGGFELWNDLRPSLERLMSGLKAALSAVGLLFGERKNSDPAVPRSNSNTPIRDSRDLEIDAAVTTADISIPTSITDAALSLIHMLRWDLANASYRLSDPRLEENRWLLLGEVQELRGRCTQAFEALVATVFRGLTDVALEGLLPRYLSSTRRAIELRTAFTHLRVELEELNRRVQHARSLELPLLHDALVKAMERFTLQPGFQYIRASDKREVIRFRLFLRDWTKAGSPEREFKHKVEGFAKFSEAFTLVNRRTQLLAHDREVLQEALDLAKKKGNAQAALTYLEEIYGRSSSIDALVRAHWAGEAIDAEALVTPIEHALSDLK